MGRIKSKCWREASIFEFLYNLLAKLKRRTQGFYTFKSYYIGVLLLRSLRRSAYVILVRSSRIKKTSGYPIRKDTRIVELLILAYQFRMISIQTSGFREVILYTRQAIRASEGLQLYISSRTFRVYNIVLSSRTLATLILYLYFLELVLFH